MVGAFWDLHADRQVSMGGYGPIPFQAIDRYAERYGVVDFQAFHRLLRALDNAFLEHQAAKTPKRKG